MILNTGDVPNLYEHDEKAEIIEKVTFFLAATQQLCGPLDNCNDLLMSKPNIFSHTFVILQSELLLLGA